MHSWVRACAPACLVSIAVLSATVVHAGDFEFGGDLVPADRRSSDWGQVHALDGDDRLLLSWTRFGGQPAPAPACGEVLVHRRDSTGNFAHLATLTAADVDGSCKAGDLFGGDIQIHGDLLLIASAAGLRAGSAATDADAAVYLFERDENRAAGWRGVGKIKPQSLPSGRGFGILARTNGDWIAVQQHRYESIHGFRFQIAEAVHLFRRGSGVGDWQPAGVLQESRPYFGFSVQFAGDDLLIGAPETVQSTQQGPGRVYVYRPNAAGAWSRVQELSVAGEHNLGYALAVSGERAVATAVNLAGRGKAHVFERSGGDWSRVQTLQPAQGQNNDLYGTAVAISGDTLVVGAQNGRDTQATRGRVHVYLRGGDGRYSESQTLVAPDATRNDLFGNHLSLAAGTLVVASPGATINGDRAGVFLYQRDRGGSAFRVEAGISGLWFDPARDGEGFSVEVLDGDQALVIWYTYDLVGGQLWLIGVGEIDGGSIVVDPLVLTTGTRFGPDFDPDQVERAVWGRLRMDFDDCDHGRFSFEGPAGYGSGSHSLRRLGALSGVACGGSMTGTAHSEFSGHFYDLERSGEGFAIQMLDTGDGSVVPVGYWFTYTPNGQLAWLMGVGSMHEGRFAAQDVFQPVGARFGSGFDAGDVERLPWGQWTIDFQNCRTARLNYSSTRPGYLSVAQTLTRLTRPQGVDCP